MKLPKIRLGLILGLRGLVLWTRIGPSKPEFHSNRHHRVFSNSENFSPLKGNTKEGKERSSISANRQNGKKFSPSVASTTSSSPRRPTPNSILSQLFYLQSLWNKSWKLVITVVFVVQVPLQLLQFLPSPRAGLSFPKCAFPSLSISMLSVRLAFLFVFFGTQRSLLNKRTNRRRSFIYLFTIITKPPQIFLVLSYFLRIDLFLVWINCDLYFFPQINIEYFVLPFRF